MTTLITIVSIIALILAVIALLLLLKYVNYVNINSAGINHINKVCGVLREEFSILRNNIEQFKQSSGAKLGEFKKRMEYVECEEHDIIVAKINIIAVPNSIEKPTELVHMSCNLCGKEWFKDMLVLNEPERCAYFAFKKIAPNVEN